MIVRRRLILPGLLCLIVLAALEIFAQSQYPSAMLAGLMWRDVGPMRGGRTFGRRRPRRPARHLLFRLGGRRRVEDRERRPHLVPDLR